MNPSESNFDHVIPSISHIADRYCDDSWTVPYKKWDFHNFMFVLSGEGTAKSEGEKCKIDAGTLMYHYPGQRFACESHPNNHLHMFVVNFQLASAFHDSDNWTLTLATSYLLKISKNSEH